MTWIDICLSVDPTVKKETANNILWSETCYPFGTVRQIYYQIRSALRAHKNGITRCEMCGMMLPFHRPRCPEKPV
jgi:hypothetical protein